MSIEKREGLVSRVKNFFSGSGKEKHKTPYQQMSDEVDAYFAQREILREIARGRGLPVSRYDLKSDPRLLGSEEDGGKHAINVWREGGLVRAEENQAWIKVLGPATVKSAIEGSRQCPPTQGKRHLPPR